jgi:hypothetical protein
LKHKQNKIHFPTTPLPCHTLIDSPFVPIRQRAQPMRNRVPAPRKHRAPTGAGQSGGRRRSPGAARSRARRLRLCGAVQPLRMCFINKRRAPPRGRKAHGECDH